MDFYVDWTIELSGTTKITADTANEAAEEVSASPVFQMAGLHVYPEIQRVRYIVPRKDA